MKVREIIAMSRGDGTRSFGEDHLLCGGKKESDGWELHLCLGFVGKLLCELNRTFASYLVL